MTHATFRIVIVAGLTLGLLLLAYVVYRSSRPTGADLVEAWSKATVEAAAEQKREARVCAESACVFARLEATAFYTVNKDSAVMDDVAERIALMTFEEGCGREPTADERVEILEE